MNVNKTIEKVSKRNLVDPADLTFRFKGKTYTMTLYRHYDGRHVSICNRKMCKAGKDCCHYYKVDGIGLCCSLSDNYTLRVSKDLSHLFAQGIRYSEEEDYIKFAQNVLDAIGGEREVDNLRVSEDRI